MMNNNAYPRCVRCRQRTGILERSVHTYRVVCGERYELFVAQLCEKCADGAISHMEAYILKIMPLSHD